MVAAFDLVVCLAMMFVILALTNKPVKPSVPTYGKVAATIAWTPKSNDDIDLYVRDPSGDVCFFGAPNVGLMHLEQDDLGYAITGTQTLPDGKTVHSTFNGERTVLTGIVPGQYVVNVHVYRKVDRGADTVIVQLWLLQGSDKILLTKNVVLHKEGDEITVWRFTLSADGHVSNVNDLKMNLVSPGSPVTP